MTSLREQFRQRKYEEWMEGAMNAGIAMTPTQVAVLIYGRSEDHSRSRGARHVREIARRMFPSSAPGQGHTWLLDPAQVRLIQREIRR